LNRKFIRSGDEKGSGSPAAAFVIRPGWSVSQLKSKKKSREGKSPISSKRAIVYSVGT